MTSRISYAQNGEDVRIWHAFGPVSPPPETRLTYVDVGANRPFAYSLTAALYRDGWSGLLVEADPDLASELRAFRPRDTVVEAVAAAAAGDMDFYRVPGTGLGTMDVKEAEAAGARGFDVELINVSALPLDRIIAEHFSTDHAIHAMSIDVEGAEATVLQGLRLEDYRPWVLCVEAVAPGSSAPTHQAWEPQLLERDYSLVAFDGINRWYVANERAATPVATNAGAHQGTTIAEAIATPFHALDIGQYGWITADSHGLRQREHENDVRQAWQRELLLHEKAVAVPREEYQKQIGELRNALVAVEGSRTFAVSRGIATMGKKGLGLARRVRARTPEFLDKRIVRERHLKHVTINMQHLTDPAFRGDFSDWSLGWASGRPRPPRPPGLDFAPLTDSVSVHDWLDRHVFDSDVELDSRMDNVGDEVGRTRRALRTRLRLRDALPGDNTSTFKGRIAFDARCLQTAAFGQRGIGRFAHAALRAVREAIGDELVTLVVDPGLDALDEDIVGSCTLVSRVRKSEVGDFGALIQPSPMTHDPEPIASLLEGKVASMAVVFDFIPMHSPGVYLRHVADTAEYAARLDALRCYGQFVCISRTVQRELTAALDLPRSDPRIASSQVAWPRDIHIASRTQETPVRQHRGPIVLMTGDDPRKNTFGGLAGIAAATSDDPSRDVVVIGMAGQGDRVHHWSIAAAMRPGEAITKGRLSDDELADLLRGSACVVVPSFDEGLSLPLIEAARVGAPVVVSDIPSHRELLGRHSGLCDPTNPRSISRAVSAVLRGRRVSLSQQKFLRRHSHEILEEVIGEFALSRARHADASSSPRRSRSGDRLSVGVATPWSPQRSGVADFSTTTLTELAKEVDLTVYTTADADVDADYPITQRSVEAIFEDPEAVVAEHDVLAVVIGNSHFHLPFVEVQQIIDAVAIAHDTRMTEFYLALRGPGGLQQVMLHTADPDAPPMITPALDDQIRDMRLLQNAGFWEVARRSTALVMHTPGSAERIERETGRALSVLPFANQRVPDRSSVTDRDRKEARARLGLDAFDSDVIHLGTFGYVDVRTKLTDVVLEAAGWLTLWGHQIALHVIGAASDQQRAELEQRAQYLSLVHFQITGFQTEEQFQDWLMAVDLGVQLRVSPLLGVSGPLSDLAAFGTPAVASRGLCEDVQAPEFIHRLPDAVSPVTVAETILEAVRAPVSLEKREILRKDYLARLAPQRYAEELLRILYRASEAS